MVYAEQCVYVQIRIYEYFVHSVILDVHSQCVAVDIRLFIGV